MIRIAVDAMGGDHAPSAIVDGAVAAARHLDVQIALTGVPGAIEDALGHHADWRQLGLAIVAAFALAGLVGIGLLLETGDRGGRLVYQHGVGTARE